MPSSYTMKIWPQADEITAPRLTSGSKKKKKHLKEGFRARAIVLQSRSPGLFEVLIQWYKDLRPDLAYK